MKSSKYNLFFGDHEGNRYAFNGISGGLLMLSDKDSKKIQEILTTPPNLMSEDDLDSRIMNPLRDGGFIVDDKVDELEILKARNRIVRFSGKTLFLTIMTTHSCNFRCNYCFQDHYSQSMSPEVQDLLVDFVSYSVKSCERLFIHWFGGEPLLCIPLIRSLSTQFMKICEANSCHYSASLSTNGYLLKENVAAELSQLGIKNIRVTLDGPPEIHNKRRPLADGHDTFDVILENILAASKYVNMGLRINIDQENIRLVPALLDILEACKLGKGVLCDFVPTTPFASSCTNNCFSAVPDDNLWDSMKKIYEMALGRGIGLRLSSIIKARHCSFDDANSLVINTDGKMYKCSLDEKHLVGNLDSREPMKYKLNYLPWAEWISSDPFIDSECRECKMLPMCMGGCTLKGQIFGKESKCPVWKNHPGEYILINVAAGINEPLH
jgi:uncharacterized protein